MPTYEYKCPAGHVFEKFYPTIRDNRRIKCPTCGKLAERMISGGASFVFKGSGFYATDYKRGGGGGGDAQKKQEGEAKPAEPKPAESKPADGAKKKKDSGDK
jgi:putative FmdB family regulatory protein